MNPHVLAGAKALLYERKARLSLRTIESSVDEVWDLADDQERQLSLSDAEATLHGAYPELRTGTHAVLPVEATEEMVDYAERAEGIGAGTAENVYNAMVRAYLKAEKAE